MKSPRRKFLKRESLLMASAGAALTVPFELAATTPAPAPATTAAPASSAPIAETTYGKLRGRTEGGIHVFRGVHYGADTSGKNRFMPPQKPAAWTDVRDALTWGHVAPQPLESGNYDYSRGVQWYVKPGGTGEDCLVLNIWTPALKDGGKRAVMFSIHGGGFTNGASSNPVFDGHALAHRGNVVVVTINHRLGALGYLHLGDLAPEFAQSSVAGMMDIVLALQWVHDNIGNFGGDPGKVMIFGQSGGGAKVCHLMAMPSAKGLFHRAGVESGAAIRSGTHDRATRNTERMLTQLGLPKSRFHEMQDVPFEMLVGAGAASGAQFGPMVDGTVVPRDPFDPDAPAISADVPLIAGSNLNDFIMGRTDFSIDEATAQEELKKTLGDDTARIWNAYRAADPKSTPPQLEARISNDHLVRANTRTIIERKAALGKAPGFLYLVTWAAPYMGGRYGAVHGTEVPLVFRNPERWPLTADAPDGRAMAERVSECFVAFAKMGNPSTAELPWPAYNPDTKPTMLFDNPGGAKNDPDHDLLALLPKSNTP